MKGSQVNHLLSTSLLENKRHDLPEHCYSDLETASPCMTAMIAELIHCLRASDLYEMWSSDPEVLLWLLFTGICGSCDTLDRGWLMGEMRHGLKLLGIETSSALEALLKSLLYTDNMREKYVDPIWLELHT